MTKKTHNWGGDDITPSTALDSKFTEKFKNLPGIYVQCLTSGDNE